VGVAVGNEAEEGVEVEKKEKKRLVFSLVEIDVEVGVRKWVR
jgi:hypothetical protein